MSEKEDKSLIENIEISTLEFKHEEKTEEGIIQQMNLDNKIKENQNPVQIISRGISLGVLYLLTYPLYTEFLRRRVTCLAKDIKQSDFKFEKLKLFGKGGLYIGFPLFYISKFLPYFIVEYFRVPEKYYFFWITISNLFGYPLFINSNLKALKAKEALKLNSIRNIFNLYTSYSSYKGGFYYIFYNWLFFCPIVNYFCHYLESARLAYTVGPYFGYDFKSLKETRIYLTKKNSLSWGRFFFNFPAHLLNLYVFSSLSFRSLSEIDKYKQE